MEALESFLQWFLGYNGDILGGIGDIAGGIYAMGLMRMLLGVFFVIIPYFVHGYALMCTGRKAKLDSDFMPFIPIARQIYQMKIAKCPIWYIFFFGLTTITCGTVGLVLFLVSMITKSQGIIIALAMVYFLANMVITFLYYQKFYSAFGFNPNAAWLNIIPTFTLVSMSFTMLIAFSNSIRYGKYVESVSDGKGNGNDVPTNRGVIVGLDGMYHDAVFDLADGKELIFGRDPQQANIVFDQAQTDISRKHCKVRYDGRTNQYSITDYSSTGTYLDNGTRLESGQPKQVARGSIVYLGSTRKNSFRLN